MPNWCYNELEVSGNNDSLEKLQRFFENGFSLEKISPTPQELVIQMYDDVVTGVQATTKSGFPLWFEWRLKNWGTKWDIRHESFNDCEKTEFTPTEKDSVQVKFHTAWQPPMLALKTLSEKFKDLKFKLYYIDEMFNFQGDAEIENGDIPLWSQKDELLA
tara:strand:+ start:2476 stop:2955 length:480 start_codon:yes stop_codon:yes gene_type:complete